MELENSLMLDTYLKEVEYREKLSEKIKCNEPESLENIEKELSVLSDNLRRSIEKQKSELKNSLALAPMSFVKTFFVSLENSWAISPHEAKIIFCGQDNENPELFRMNLRAIAYHKIHGENYANVFFVFNVLDVFLYKLPQKNNKILSVPMLGRYLKNKTIYGLEVLPTDDQIKTLRMISYGKKVAECIDLKIKNMKIVHQLKEFY